MKRQITMLALALALAAPSVFAATGAQLKAIKKTINSTTIPELPAIAAELVTKAAKEDREAVAITAVRTAILKSRSSAPSVVAAISKAAPEVAAPVSRVAAEMEAGQSASIAAAAVDAAPQAKAEIVASVQKGVLTATSSSSIASLGAASETSSASQASGSGLTTRDSARTVHGGKSNNRVKPINENNGNGRFPTSPPHGRNPPGHDPNHQGRPDFVDYTKPRSF
jgi:hypothetical protein